MKNLILIIFCLTFFSCKAQSVEGLHNPTNYGYSGYYYKDLYNDLDFFEGTWVYSNANTSLTIVFLKKEMKQIQRGSVLYYMDAIIGEYHYIENGIEKINTLSNLVNNHDNPYDYNITGSTIKKYGDLNCPNCEPGNILIRCVFSDPECDINSTPTMVFRYYVEDGVAKLHLNFYSGPITGNLYGIEPQCDNYAVPFGEYILIKQ